MMHERSFAKCYFIDEKSGKMRIESKKQKMIFSSNFFVRMNVNLN